MLALGMGMLFTQIHRFKKDFASLAIGLIVGFALSLSVSLNSMLIVYSILFSIVVLTMILMSRYFSNSLNQSNKASVKIWYNLPIVGFGVLAIFHGATHVMKSLQAVVSLASLLA